MDTFEEINELPQNNDIHAWIDSQLKNESAKTLLAFADDGVIWGTWDGANLDIAQNVPALRGETLQQAYLFDADQEIRLFHDELDNWKSVKVSSNRNDSEHVIVESQILWGDKLDENDQPTQTGFMRLLAERKGIPPQIYPIKEEFGSLKCVRLEVHHLIKYNTDGEAYIAISRLARLSVGNKAEEV